VGVCACAVEAAAFCVRPRLVQCWISPLSSAQEQGRKSVARCPIRRFAWEELYAGVYGLSERLDRKISSRSETKQGLEVVEILCILKEVNRIRGLCCRSAIDGLERAWRLC
jgi:hypothetical protein